MSLATGVIGRRERSGIFFDKRGPSEAYASDAEDP